MKSCVTRRIRFAALATSIIAIAAINLTNAEAATVAVTSCGQTVSGRAVLTGDLDCTGTSAPGITLAHRGSFDAAGFTLSGGDGDGLFCQGVCKIFSSEDGGSIEGFAGNGVVSFSTEKPLSRIRVQSITVANNGGDGARVDNTEGHISVSRATISGNAGNGAVAPERARIGRSEITGNGGTGVIGDSIKLQYAEITFNGLGVDALSYLGAVDSGVNDNLGDGIHIGSHCRTRRVNVLRNGQTGIVFDTIHGDAQVFFIEISDNGLDGVRVENPQIDRLRFKIAFIRRNGRHGVYSGRMRANQSRIDENAFNGIYAPPGGECNIQIDRFTLVDNGTNASCGVSVTCADIASCETPRALHPSTECDTSYDTSSGFPGNSWNLCTFD